MSTAPRRIALRTRGHGHGPITRLMSPSDLGQVVKPFVFLDIFDIHAIASQPASQPGHGDADSKKDRRDGFTPSRSARSQDKPKRNRLDFRPSPMT